MSTGAALNFGWAWIAAAGALALHVTDEAAHDFLSWYNPRAARIRRLLRGVPFPPTFTFWPWLIALGVGIGVLAGLTPSAFAGTAWMRPVASVLGAIHVLNGALHIGAALLAKRAVPGVLSAPALLATGIWLWHAAGQLP